MYSISESLYKCVDTSLINSNIFPYMFSSSDRLVAVVPRSMTMVVLQRMRGFLLSSCLVSSGFHQTPCKQCIRSVQNKMPSRKNMQYNSKNNIHMCIYIYIYICVYIHMCIHMCIYTHIVPTICNRYSQFVLP